MTQSGKRIFVVEDEAVVALELQDLLRGAGYEICGHSARGEVALREIPAARPDLVLMDVNLGGGMSGMDVAERLGGTFDAPVLFLTAYTDQELTERAGRAGGTYAYLTKPFDPRVLAANIELALVRHSASRALRASEGRYRGLFVNALDGIFIASLDGVVIDVNPAFATMLGYEGPHELVGTSAAALYADPGERERLEPRYDEAGVLPGVEVALRKKGGEEVVVELRARRLREDKGEGSGYQGFARDVTAQRRHEEALRVLSTRITRLSGTALFEELARQLASVVGADLAFIARVLPATPPRVEPRAVVVGGLSVAVDAHGLAPTASEELAHGRIVTVTAGAARRFPEIALLARNQIEGLLALPLRHSGGEVMGYVGVATRAPLDAPEGVEAIVQLFALRIAGELEREGVEEQRARLEEQLRQAQKMEALGTLAGGIAHDFNNVLAAVVANVEVARASSAAAPIRDQLDEIAAASLRAAELVKQILAFGRRQPAKRVVTSLGGVVVEVARLLRATLPAGIDLVTQVEADVPAVFVDPSQIHQVLMNLGTNAWQAIERATGTITIRVVPALVSVEAPPVAGVRPGRYACIQVTDDGIGMSPATLERVFEPFFTTKSVGVGTGLGLAVAHGIVAQHGGGIAVRSEVGEGTTFSVYLPEAQVPATPQAPASPTPARGAGHVLLVDDEPVLVRRVAQLLERLGYRVSGFVSSREALDALRAEPAAFDLVLTDLNMPELGGLELARAAGAIRADLPVVLVSGNRTHTDEQLAASNVRHFLEKPFTVATLGETVARALGR